MLAMSHGTFVWHDLMTTDADRARGFYGELLGWRFEPIALGPFTAWRIASEDRVLGTIMPEPSLPSSHWMPYVAVADLDAAIAHVTELGGSVCAGAMEVPPLGRFAIAGDPQGGWFSLLERSAAEPPAIGRHAFAYDELATSDAQAAVTFYAVLFGWTFATLGEGAAPYRVVRHAGRDLGGVRAQSLFARPSWLPSLEVDDVDATCARAAQLGGRVVSPGVIADPTGATVGLRAITSR
jgi:predicted enzyme related to lactoylglutathione lyase